MVDGISSALTALKTAFDIAKGIKDLDNQAALNSAVIDLQQSILSAQQSALEAQEANAAMKSEIDNLEAQLQHLTAWQAEAEDYELTQIDRSVYAYMRKEDLASDEPRVWLCPSCFERGIKGILQVKTRTPDRQFNVLQCTECSNNPQVSFRRKPEELYRG